MHYSKIRKKLCLDKCPNTAQIGGIETSVLDNGLGRGMRIAWVTTGSGLRYKVAIDRGLDIVDAFYGNSSLAWLSHGATIGSRPNTCHGSEWLNAFNGGLLTTCGLTHVGPPEHDDHEQRGMHGRISNIPAQIESILLPDIHAGQLVMSITGIVKQTMVFGPNIELRRTISSHLQESVIYIADTITNRGNTKVPLMVLYHFNFGWPLVDEGTEILWNGVCTSAPFELSRQVFGRPQKSKLCSAPLKEHCGSNDADGYIDIAADSQGMCFAGLYNKNLGLAIMLRFKKSQLPWLTNWQHWGYGEYVAALEPGTNPPVGQNEAKKSHTLMYLQPGQSKQYNIGIEVLTYDSYKKR